jgi:hypothetical protein
VQSAAVQHVPFATQAPSAHTFWFDVVRLVSQPSLSGAVELQSAQPAAHPV